jgi:putative acyl-CoA dehydrogenase
MTICQDEPKTTAFTHEVFNQPTPLVDFNLFLSDIVLVDGLKRHRASWAYERVSEYGQRMGSAEVLEWADQANRYTPVLKTFDRFGHRIDEVDFHPAFHKMMGLSAEYGLHNLPWAENKEGSHVARAALMYLAYQTEAGHCCPMSMTYSVVPALRLQPELAKIWEPRLVLNGYDGKLKPANEKPGVIFGMGMTEKQGGSDVRANTTRAVPLQQRGPAQPYRITGHKWFCSAPMSDAFLILAQAQDGLSCFLVPRFLEDGTKNNFFIQRLKDKLGNKSNASSEVEFRDTIGYLVGNEGRGVPTIIEMVNHTRLDCAVGSASVMRQATLQAVHHCSQRSAFGKKLVEQELMQNVLADLAVESEAATLLVLRLAESYDTASSNEEQAFRRIVSAVSKYWICKRAPQHAYEAMECHGGAGYVEESVMPRLFRESPLNSIWEGSGNVISLDVLRAVAKEDGVIESIRAELNKASGSDIRFDKYADEVINELQAVKRAILNKEQSVERTTRRLVERMALALQGSLVVRFSPDSVVDAFVSSRLDHDHGMNYGTLHPGVNMSEIVERACALN